MLFVHDETGKHAYVMRGMSFGLDIVFVAPNGTVTEIHEAAPDSRRTPARAGPVGCPRSAARVERAQRCSGRVTGSSSRWTDRDKTVPRDETGFARGRRPKPATGLSRRIAWNLRHRWRRIFRGA